MSALSRLCREVGEERAVGVGPVHGPVLRTDLRPCGRSAAPGRRESEGLGGSASAAGPSRRPCQTHRCSARRRPPPSPPSAAPSPAWLPPPSASSPPPRLRLRWLCLWCLWRACGGATREERCGSLACGEAPRRGLTRRELAGGAPGPAFCESRGPPPHLPALPRGGGQGAGEVRRLGPWQSPAVWRQGRGTAGSSGGGGRPGANLPTRRLSWPPLPRRACCRLPTAWTSSGGGQCRWRSRCPAPPHLALRGGRRRERRGGITGRD